MGQKIWQWGTNGSYEHPDPAPPPKPLTSSGIRAGPAPAYLDQAGLLPHITNMSGLGPLRHHNHQPLPPGKGQAASHCPLWWT